MKYQFTHGQIVAMADYLHGKGVNTKETTQIFFLYIKNGGSLEDIGLFSKRCSIQESDFQIGFSGSFYVMSEDEKKKEGPGFSRGYKLVERKRMKDYHLLAEAYGDCSDYPNPSCGGFLTKNGNILLSEGRRHAFFTSSGEFIREVSENEAKYLSTMCPTVVVHWGYQPQWPEEFPVWHFIKRIQVLEDESSFKPGTCNNGGDYSFQTYHDWFVVKYPDGEWKFAFVESFETSADFQYDQLTNSFQQNLGSVWIANGTGECPKYRSQDGISYEKGNTIYDKYEMLEKVGEISTFEHLWNEIYEYIPPRDEGGKAKLDLALSLSDKKKIISRLKELGVTRTQNPRRGKRGVRR